MKKKRKVQHPGAKQQAQSKIHETKVLPPDNLTPMQCDKLRLDLLDACKKVAESHGLQAEGGELSNIDLRHGFDIGFRVGIPMPDGALYSAEKALFEALAEHYGLQPFDYGKTFTNGGEVFRITAINPNRPKYPVSAERISDGRGFKFAVENVVMCLRNSQGR